jgi:hypothetical protein
MGTLIAIIKRIKVFVTEMFVDDFGRDAQKHIDIIASKHFTPKPPQNELEESK